jgi:hypothetical protein
MIGYAPGFSDPREYSSMEVSRTLKRFARRISRGTYEMLGDWYAAANRADTNTPVITAAEADHSCKCTCKAMDWGYNNIEFLRRTWKDGYKSVTDKGLHFLDGRKCVPFKKQDAVNTVPNPCENPNCLVCSPQPDPEFVPDLIDAERIKVIEVLEDTIASKNKTIQSLNLLLRSIASDIISIRDGSLYSAVKRLTDLHNTIKSSDIK